MTNKKLESLLRPTTSKDLLIKNIKQIYSQTESYFLSIKENCIALGLLLTELKNRTKAEGKSWQEAYPKFAFSFDLRMAQYYMNAAKPENQEVVKQLPPDTGIGKMMAAIRRPKEEPKNETHFVSVGTPVEAEFVEPEQLETEYSDCSCDIEPLMHLRAEVEQLRQQLAANSRIVELEQQEKTTTTEGFERTSQVGSAKLGHKAVADLLGVNYAYLRLHNTATGYKGVFIPEYLDRVKPEWRKIVEPVFKDGNSGPIQYWNKL
jgi:hypothetical protein